MAANVDSSLANWSTTASSNQPDGSDTADLNAEFQQIQAVVRKYLATKGSDIASASTVDLSSATGNYVHITGTTTITALGTVAAGLRYLLVFDGALTFTHNATSLIIPGGANITTAAGDRCEVVSLGSGNWRVLWYTKASGAPIGSYQPLDATLTALASSLSAAGKIPYATATDTLGELDFKDEDNMASNSATGVPSQQSVKAYVDTSVTNAVDEVIANASTATPDAAADYILFEDATDSVQKKALISAIVPSSLTQGTAQATTSGTAKDFTSIPSGTKMIAVNFAGVSVSGASQLAFIQIGTGGSPTTSGYVHGLGDEDTLAASSAYFEVRANIGTTFLSSANPLHGTVTLRHLGSNTWIAEGTVFESSTGPTTIGISRVCGYVTLAGELDMVRFGCNGTGAFDAGSVNIQYM